MEERLLEEIKKLHTEIDAIMKFIPKLDIVSNQRYCEIREEMGMPVKPRTLKEWFTRPDCPRYDKHHVYFSKMNVWAEETFKPKSKSA